MEIGGARMERLTGLDAAFLAMETPSMHMHVSAVMVFEPGDANGDERLAPGFGRMREFVAERMHLVPPLHRRVVRIPFGLNHPLWTEDSSFDLDYHIHRARLPEPGGPQELAAFAGEVAGRPLEGSRPLWEMHFVEGLESGHVAVVSKLHHALIDGVSGAEVMAAFLDPTPAPVSHGAASRHAPRRQQKPPSEPELVAWALTSLVSHPERAFDVLRNTVGAARKLAERNRRLREEEELHPPPAPFRAPRTSLNGAISARRRFSFLQVPLEDLRSVRHSFGGTVNDVLLTGVAGALRRLLSGRGETLHESLVALVPMSTRGPNDGPTRLGDPEALGNKLSAMLVSLATSVADPVERLCVISEGTRLAKEQARVLTDDIIGGWAQLALPAVASRLARLTGNLKLFDHVRPLFNVVVSNIAGPEFPLWFDGSKLVAAYPVGPIIEGVGLNVTAFSYQEALFIGLLGCRELVPEVDHIAELLSESIAELVKSAARAGGHWA
ncbi:MAG: WS/DGAT/MGAT family O-acyltransferase [Nitrososphaerales archaeon]